MEKICSKCLISKPHIEFSKHKLTKDKLSNTCKSCKHLAYKELRQRKLNGENFVYEKECKICKQVKPRDKFTFSVTSDGLFPYCKECHSRSLNKKYYTEDGRKSHRASTNKYSRKKYHSNDRYKLMMNLSRNFNLILQNGRSRKKWTKYEILIGYEISDFVNINGNKPSELHQIDHKIPISWFLDDCPVNIVWDIRNLWWVTKEYNNRKGSKWCDPIPEEYLNVIKPYLKKDILFEKDYNS